jgi:uncharacterized protein
MAGGQASPEFQAAILAYDLHDESRALHLMEQCALSDDAAACFMMALWCAGKEGMPVDKARSEHWLQRFVELAEDGNLEAAWDLGQNYRFGNLLQQDVGLANYWLGRAAEGGHAEAQHHLAWFYETGQYNYPINQALAEDWYQKAFEQGHPETLYLFAMRQCKDGKPNEAGLKLLKEAADKGFRQAGHFLNALAHEPEE